MLSGPVIAEFDSLREFNVFTSNPGCDVTNVLRLLNTESIPTLGVWLHGPSTSDRSLTSNLRMLECLPLMFREPKPVRADLVFGTRGHTRLRTIDEDDCQRFLHAPHVLVVDHRRKSSKTYLPQTKLCISLEGALGRCRAFPHGRIGGTRSRYDCHFAMALWRRNNTSRCSQILGRKGG